MINKNKKLGQKFLIAGVFGALIFFTATTLSYSRQVPVPIAMDNSASSSPPIITDGNGCMSLSTAIVYVGLLGGGANPNAVSESQFATLRASAEPNGTCLGFDNKNNELIQYYDDALISDIQDTVTQDYSNLFSPITTAKDHPYQPVYSCQTLTTPTVSRCCNVKFCPGPGITAD